MFRLLTSKPCIRCLSRQKNQTKRKSNSNKLDRKKRTKKKERKKERKLDRLLLASGLLLSIVSCTALIHVEVRIQDHHRLILHWVAKHCDHLEKEILRNVRQDYERWQVKKGSYSGDDWKQIRSEWELPQSGGAPVCWMGGRGFRNPSRANTQGL